MMCCLACVVCVKANSSLSYISAHDCSTAWVPYAVSFLLTEYHLGLHQADPARADALDDGADGDELAAAIDQLDPVSLLGGQLAHQHGLAMADAALLLRVGGHLAEGERDLVEGDPGLSDLLAGPPPLVEAVGADGRGNLERADLGAPQPREVGAHA